MVDWEQISKRLVDIESFDIGPKSMKIDTGRRSLDKNIPTIVNRVDDVRLESVTYREETDSLHVFLVYDRHSRAEKEETEIRDGYELYKDVDTGVYVAAHPTYPVSSTGETKQEALKNAKEAVSLYESD